MPITTETIWQELHDNLRTFIARRVAPEDVDDLLQEVFVRIHRGLATLAARERVQAWVYQITRNVIIDYYRARARSGGTAEATALDALLADGPDDDGDGPAAPRRELATCLAPLLTRLPPSYRDALTLSDFQGEPQRVAAERLGLSLPGLKSRVQRGRARLRDQLLACCHLEFDHRGVVVDYQCRGSRCCEPAPANEPTEPAV